MKKLHELPPEKEIWTGAIFREFRVGRLDAPREEDDYYDLMLFDLRFVRPNAFMLVNVTVNSDNRGRFPYLLDNVESEYYISASVLQQYFDPESEIYLMDDWQKNVCNMCN